MNNELNTNLANVNLKSAGVDPAITVRSTGILGADFLAIGDKVLFTTFVYKSKAVRLYAIVDGGFITFVGGLFGNHSIAANAAITSAARVLAHWEGYVKATGDKIDARICGLVGKSR